ncbi:threonine-phosphate decarboxylase [Proteiniclasticum sp. SCR006]|uniref:threonine-phosphate decarboxylase n=1 Tax=Proteiniclasticum aestuarii TaxID=2817862 RepID=A0A939H8B8_9CLOT|nr:threonine-phosphate decarboxylase CobD [Proteiniclasticum aestuarii]MBO1263485.1 threonine-phosphate decarboxylase [Proteiniclasticum aestuarii]
MNYHGGDIYRYKEEMTDFSANINPLGIPEHFSKVLLEDLSCLTRYPDRQYRKLKASIMSYLQLDQEAHVVLGNGAIEVIYKTIQALPVKRVLIACPTFSEYERAARMAGIPVQEEVLYDREGKLDGRALADLLEEKDLVILCNPNNPTGTLTSKDELLALGEMIKERRGYLVIDETFIEFTRDYPETSILDAKEENIIVIRALTKYFGMPGVRLGYGVFHQMELASEVEERMEPWHINSLADLAGQTVLHDRTYQEATRKWILEERTFFMKELEKLRDFTFLPTDSNFILVTSKTHKAEKIQEMLLGAGLLIRLPIGFKGLSDYAFRIAIKDHASNRKLLAELKKMDRS